MTTPTVTSLNDTYWAVEFDDGPTMHCPKQPRDEDHLDALTADTTKREDDKQTARLQAAITAVREHESQATP